MSSYRARPQRFRRRAAFLGYLGVVAIMRAYPMLHSIPPYPGYSLWFGTLGWGWLWLGVGIACFTGIIGRYDRPAFSIAAGLMTFWAAQMTDIWLAQGKPDGWTMAVTWLAFAAITLVVASWPEPAAAPLRPPDPQLPGARNRG
jgi:hypothetical protein